MQTDIKAVKALANFRLQVELTDGRKGVLDLGPHLQQPALSALRDVAYFEQVSVFYGAATWPGGEDITPATLAADLLAEQPA